MKKIISKILIILILFVMLFEFCFSSSVSYAFDVETDAESWVNRITSLMGGIISVKFWIFRLQATAVVAVFWEVATMSLAESCGISTDTFFDWSSGKLMTPFDIFFNKYNILNVNFFEIEETNFWQSIGSSNIIKNLRLSVAAWYYAFRNISAVILMCILIYVGIRMALSTIAEEKAKYQKMLYDWVCSFILIFVLQYIIIFTIEANNAIIKFIRNSLVVRTEVGGFDFVAGTYTTMDGIIGKMALQSTTGIGLGSFTAIIALFMIFFQTLSFFFAYMNRVLKVAFLIIISPLISLTYSIDKIGDGKAQALNSWLKEFVYTILIQPFHAILYMAFANTAMALLSTTNIWTGALDNIIGGNYNEIVNAVLVILCLKFVGDGEKIIRKIFNFQDDSSKTSLAAGAAVGLAGLNMMKKGAQIGSKVAGVANKFGGIPTKFAKTIQSIDQLDKVKQKFDKTPLGKKMQTKAFQDGIKNLANKVDRVKGSKAMQLAKRGINGVKKFEDKHKFIQKAGKPLSALNKIVSSEKFKKYLPYTLALMGAAMSYSTGTSGAMQAIGMGNAFKQGADGYFSASGDNQAEEGKNQLEAEVLANTKDYQDNERALGENAYKSENVRKDLAEVNKRIAKQKGHEDFERRWEEAREKRKSSDGYERIQGEKQEDQLRQENKELYDDLEERRKLEEKEASLHIEKDDLLKKKKEIEDTVHEKMKTASPEMLRRILQNMDRSKDTLSKAKTDMLKAIEEAMIERKMKDAGKDPTKDSHVGFELTDDEKKEAKTTREHMMMLMDRSVIGSGSDFNSRQEALNLFGQKNSCVSDLEKAMESYKSSKRASEYCTARDNCGKFGSEEEKFMQDVITKMTGEKFSIFDCLYQDGDEEHNLKSLYKEWNEHYND